MIYTHFLRMLDNQVNEHIYISSSFTYGQYSLVFDFTLHRQVEESTVLRSHHGNMCYCRYHNSEGSQEVRPLPITSAIDERSNIFRLDACVTNDLNTWSWAHGHWTLQSKYWTNFSHANIPWSERACLVFRYLSQHTHHALFKQNETYEKLILLKVCIFGWWYNLPPSSSVAFSCLFISVMS